MKIKSIFIRVLLPISLSLFSCKVAKQLPVQEKRVIGEESNSMSLLNEDQRQTFQYLFVEGVKQRTLGNVDEAIKIFSRCLEMDPYSSSSLYEIANIHLAKGDFQSAMMMLEKAVSISPDNKYYQLLLAKIYQQNKLYEKAAGTFAVLSTIEPDNNDYPIFRAEMLNMAGKPMDALSAYNDVEKKSGVSEQTALGKQAIFLKMGKKPEAYHELENLIHQAPGNPRYYGMLGDMYLSDSTLDKAIVQFNKVLELKPHDGFVHFSLTNYYRMKGEYDKAFQELKMGFENPDIELETKIQMYLFLAQTEDHKLSDDQQNSLIHILLERHTDDERPRALYAEYFISKKQNREAREQLKLAVELNKGNYPYWERLMYLDNDLTDWKALSEDSKEAVKYFPEQPLIYILDAVALLQMDRYQEVFSVLDSAEVNIVNNPQAMSQIYTYRAEAFYKLKKYDEAFSWFDKVVQMDPKNWLAMNNYAYYLSVRNTKLDVAEKLSSAVVQNNANNATYLDTYAWVLFKKKDFKLAKFYMESALTNNQEQNPVLLEHYGDILFFLNEKEKAVEQWNQSLKMGNPSKVLPEKIRKVVYIESEEVQ
ncbi:MAG: tetratricopeptide repeat protein [Marinilabiliales bacterium]|nr:tetratricopeptide repeat protein [Marinilabiliales bacterium]